MNRWIIGNKTLLITRQVGTDDDGNNVAILELIERTDGDRGDDSRDPTEAVAAARETGMDAVKVAFIGLDSLDDFIEKLRVMREDMRSWIEASESGAAEEKADGGT